MIASRSSVPSEQLREALESLQRLLDRAQTTARAGRTDALTESEAAILEALVVLGPAKHHQISERVQLDGAWITRNLQRLRDRGWVRSAAQDGDKRGARVELTAAGRARAKKYLQARDALWSAMWTQLQPDTRASTHPTIVSINRALQHRLGSTPSSRSRHRR